MGSLVMGLLPPWIRSPQPNPLLVQMKFLPGHLRLERSEGGPNVTQYWFIMPALLVFALFQPISRTVAAVQ